MSSNLRKDYFNLNESIDKKEWSKVKWYIENSSVEELNKKDIINQIIRAPITLIDIALKKGVSSNIADHKGRSSIFFYDYNSCPYDLVEVFVKNNINLNHLNFYNENFFMYKFDEELFKFLHPEKIDYYQKNEFNNNLFHIIGKSSKTISKKYKVFKKLDITKLDIVNNKGLTPLHISLLNNKHKLSRILIEIGFDPKKTITKDLDWQNETILPKGLDCFELMSYIQKNIDSFFDADYYSEEEYKERKEKLLGSIEKNLTILEKK